MKKSSSKKKDIFCCFNVGSFISMIIALQEEESMLQQFKITFYAIIFALGTIITLPLKLTAQSEDVISQAPEKLPKNRKERREDRLEKLKERRELKRERRQEKRQGPSRGQGIGNGRGRFTR